MAEGVFMFRSMLVVLVLVLCCMPKLQAAESTPLHQDDPAIVKQLAALEDNTIIRLPIKHVPAQRDYSNKMVYMSDRQTAFYAGGGHNVGRWCDAWEYHLGSNTWYNLFPAEGGDHGHIKGAVYWDVPKLLKDPNTQLSAYSKEQLEKTRAWWPKFVVLKDGHLVTPGGGPLMTCHLWDGITYDEKAKKIVWVSGCGSASMAYEAHAYFTGKPVDEIKKQMDWTYTQTWMFDTVTKKWIHYRTKQKPPRIDGMGASMTYIPEWGKCLFYVAAENVSPPNFLTASFDVEADKWQELQPNGGNLRAIAGKTAPMAEAQHAYSARHKKIVAVDKKATYVYDIDKNHWSKLNDAVPIVAGDANDAQTVFGYDSVSDVWLLCDPGSKRIAAFSLTENKWELLQTKGAPIIKPQWGNGFGYFDPKFNVFVLAGDREMCVYRYKKAPVGK